MKRYPLVFRDNIHNALWGVEHWLVSGHHVSPSVIAEGPFAGRTLEELTREAGRALTGTAAPSEKAFPLLFKIIDARDRLSVQVHPNNANASATGGEPKTEMWYTLADGARIWAGLKPGTTAADVEAAVASGAFGDLLVRHETRTGEAIFIPGGLVHAIGEGSLIFEVQQSSNTTYRLYDWDRKGADGKPRALHVEASVKTIDFSLPVPEPRREVVCPYFRFASRVVSAAYDLPADPRTFRVVYIVSGNVTLDWAEGSLALGEGACTLLPASLGARVVPAGEATLLETSLI